VSPLPLAAARTSDEPGAPRLAAGYVAALPLFLAYELGVALAEPAARAPAERVLALGLEFLGPRLQLVRVAALLVLAGLALLRLDRQGLLEPGARARVLARPAGEGVVAGFLLAPALVLLQGWLGAAPLEVARTPARALDAALRLIGSAPWEELLFRVGAYGGLFLLTRRALAFLGLDARAAVWPAEFAALLGSALLFAAFHLASAQRLLGSAGEPFHAALFTWRVSAGILLGGLFRWRGFGAAAWAHALFNLGIALGLRP